MENLSVLQMLPTEIKFKHQNETSVDYSSFFPDFCWVLRDFEMEFKSLTPESYLEQCLEQEKGYSEEDEHKNKIRALLKSFFPKIECHAIAKPGLEG